MRRFAPALLLLLASTSALAKVTAPERFCAVYPESSTCQGHGTTCLECHTSTSPTTPAWNAYGIQVVLAIHNAGKNFDDPGVLEDALRSVESRDDDGDGLTNLEEIELGTLPGDAHSFFQAPPPGKGAANPSYDVGNWDAKFAARRMMVAFCGRSPTFDELNAIHTRDDVHTQLDACLSSPFWTGDGLAHLADERVKPIDLGTSFDWDYRLFRYALSGDRDVRDLLLAQYYVREASAGILTQVDDVVDDATACTDDSQCAFDSHCDTQNGNVCRFKDGPQFLEKDQRAGMIGMAWFHFINTMFSSMPRTTAAQAMRAYLGMDIARQQGIAPVPGEPLDVDHRGVTQEECAQCHATLDPATYVFAQYRGIEPNVGPSTYDPNRPIEKGLWTQATAPQGKLLGQNVSTLRDWANVAVSSDAFQMNLSRMFFHYALGRDPGAADKDEFDSLWSSWSSADVAFNADKFLHKLVDTDAFGAP